MNFKETLRLHTAWTRCKPGGVPANLTGASLDRASLTGAAGIIVGGLRSDGHAFYLVRHTPETMVKAGCRWFLLTEARAHWSTMRAGTQLEDESLALCDHMELMARILGWEIAS